MEISILSNFSWKAIPRKAKLKKEHSGGPVILPRDGTSGLGLGWFTDFSLYKEFDRNLKIIKPLPKLYILQASSQTQNTSKLSLWFTKPQWPTSLHLPQPPNTLPPLLPHPQLHFPVLYSLNLDTSLSTLPTFSLPFLVCVCAHWSLSAGHSWPPLKLSLSLSLNLLMGPLSKTKDHNSNQCASDESNSEMWFKPPIMHFSSSQHNQGQAGRSGQPQEGLNIL